MSLHLRGTSPIRPVDPLAGWHQERIETVIRQHPRDPPMRFSLTMEDNLVEQIDEEARQTGTHTSRMDTAGLHRCTHHGGTGTDTGGAPGVDGRGAGDDDPGGLPGVDDRGPPSG